MPKKIAVLIGIILVDAIVAGAFYIGFIPLLGVPVKAMEAVLRSKNRKLFKVMSHFI